MFRDRTGMHLTAFRAPFRIHMNITETFVRVITQLFRNCFNNVQVLLNLDGFDTVFIFVS